MRKIAILCSLVLFMILGSANAEISKKSDDFTGGVIVSSTCKLNNEFIEEIKLKKTLASYNSDYVIEISNVFPKDYCIKDSAIEIKVDEFPVYELNSYKYNFSQSLDNRYLFNSNIIAKLPSTVIGKIKNANRIAIKFEDIIGDERVYVLQDNVLAEWKKVIDIQNA